MGGAFTDRHRISTGNTTGYGLLAGERVGEMNRLWLFLILIVAMLCGCASAQNGRQDATWEKLRALAGDYKLAAELDLA